MPELFDLHSHSTCSDGALSPEELVTAANNAGVTHFALTDHDTVTGIASARQTAERVGMTLITGVEFSSQWRNRGVHIVGLGFDEHHPVITQAMAKMASVRQSRSEQIADKLQKLGIANALEGAKRHANGGLVGRPHFAAYLLEMGAVKNFNQAFKRYLGAGKAGDVKHQWPEMDEVVQWIHASGGAAVMAHPLKYDLTRTKRIALLNDFKACGGIAVEVISGSDQTAQDTRDLVAISNDLGLLASIGSDFHGPDMPWQALGKTGTLPPAANPVWQVWS